jgi:hypothetical protein
MKTIIIICLMVLTLCKSEMQFNNNEHYLYRKLHMINMRDDELSNDTIFNNCTEEYCSYRGRCDISQTKCICDDGYITFGKTDKECNYKQKETLVAFLLEFFLGLESGAGYFYLGQTDMGIGQLVLFWLGFIPFCFIVCCSIGSSDTNKGGVGICCAYLYAFALIFAIIGWWIAALVTIGTGKVTDGNGAPIKPW